MIYIPGGHLLILDALLSCLTIILGHTGSASPECPNLNAALSALTGSVAASACQSARLRALHSLKPTLRNYLPLYILSSSIAGATFKEDVHYEGGVQVRVAGGLLVAVNQWSKSQ